MFHNLEPLTEDNTCYHCGGLVINGDKREDEDGRVFHAGCLNEYYAEPTPDVV